MKPLALNFPPPPVPMPARRPPPCAVDSQTVRKQSTCFASPDAMFKAAHETDSLIGFGELNRCWADFFMIRPVIRRLLGDRNGSYTMA